MFLLRAEGRTGEQTGARCGTRLLFRRRNWNWEAHLAIRKALEKVGENYVVKWARKRGVLVTKMNLMGQRSWPDDCFWLPGGRPALIEFKRRGLKPTKLQQNRIDELRRLGYDVIATDDREEAIEFLQERLYNWLRGQRVRTIVFDECKYLDSETSAEVGKKISAGKRRSRSAS